MLKNFGQSLSEGSAFGFKKDLLDLVDFLGKSLPSTLSSSRLNTKVPEFNQARWITRIKETNKIIFN